jgi:hypothetical protein
MPYRSQAQWRWAFATKQKFARRWGKESKGTFKRLPKRVRRKK